MDDAGGVGEGFVDVHVDIDSDVQNIIKGNVAVELNLNEEDNDQEDDESVHSVQYPKKIK